MALPMGKEKGKTVDIYVSGMLKRNRENTRPFAHLTIEPKEV
jgi:hypothetical protein